MCWHLGWHLGWRLAAARVAVTGERRQAQAGCMLCVWGGEGGVQMFMHAHPIGMHELLPGCVQPA